MWILIGYALHIQKREYGMCFIKSSTIGIWMLRKQMVYHKQQDIYIYGWYGSMVFDGLRYSLYGSKLLLKLQYMYICYIDLYHSTNYCYFEVYHNTLWADMICAIVFFWSHRWSHIFIWNQPRSSGKIMNIAPNGIKDNDL